MFEQSQRLVPEDHPRPPLKEIVRRLKHPDLETRREAVSALGEADARAIPHLVGTLLDDDLCRAAVIALKEHGEDAEQPLLCAMGHPDPRVRERAIQALEQVRRDRQRVTRPLVQATRDPARSVRLAALGALACCDEEDEEVAVALAEALQGQDLGARRMAAWTVAYTQIQAPALLEATRRAMKDPDYFLRCLAVKAFHCRRRWTPAASADLTAATRDPKWEIRLAAVCALQRAAEVASHVPTFTEALKDGAWEVRRGAVFALADCREAAVPAVPTLATLLDDPLEDTAERVANLLGWLGPAAKEAVPSLLRAARRRGPWSQATWALGKIGVGAVPYLIKGVRTRDRKSRDTAAHGFRTFVDQCPLALSLLIEAMDHRDPVVRRECAAALPRVAGAEQGVPKLIALLGDPEGSVRAMAAWALGGIGPKASEALSALKGLASDPNARVRRLAFLSTRMIKK